jgi:hypothetical protein
MQPTVQPSSQPNQRLNLLRDQPLSQLVNKLHNLCGILRHNPLANRRLALLANHQVNHPHILPRVQLVNRPQNQPPSLVANRLHSPFQVLRHSRQLNLRHIQQFNHQPNPTFIASNRNSDGSTFVETNHPA